MTIASDITRAPALWVCCVVALGGATACGDSEAFTEYRGSGRTIDNVVRSNTTWAGSDVSPDTDASDPWDEPSSSGNTLFDSTTSTATSAPEAGPTAPRPRVPTPTVTSMNPDDFFDTQVILSATRCDLSLQSWQRQGGAEIAAAMGFGADHGAYLRCTLPPGAVGFQVVVDGDNVGVMMRPLFDSLLGQEQPMVQPVKVAGGASYEWSEAALGDRALTHVDLTLRSYDAVRSVTITALPGDTPGG